MTHRHPRDKIKEIDDLAAIAAQAKAHGKSVVLAHGVFDLIHMGHVRHLEAARNEGHVLMVTVTADPFVNKGPGRPVFPDHLRAEMLAALEFVDWVGINHAPAADTLIQRIQPTVYVKGSEYRSPDEDVTGRISDEQQAVERVGGRIVFTEGITFSSSALLNRFFDLFDPELRNYLEGHDRAQLLADAQAGLERVANFKVLIIGDAIIDEYQYVSAMGKSPKETMIATRFLERELFAGGVFAAANHVAGLCAEVEVVTLLGRAESHEKLVRQSLLPNVRLTPFFRPGAPTTRKCRFIEAGYLRKMFEVYAMDDTPISNTLERQLCKVIAERAPLVDLVIVTDFGHGLITPPVIAALSRHAPFLAVNAQSNSANLGFNLITRYHRADYVCMDAPEARLAAADKFSHIDQVMREKLAPRIQGRQMVVTHGRQGCYLHEDDGPVRHIPAFTRQAVDTVGAGDAFFAVSAPLAAAGLPIAVVGFVGNAAGAVKVNIIGHRRPVEKVPLIKFMTALLK